MVYHISFWIVKRSASTLRLLYILFVSGCMTKVAAGSVMIIQWLQKEEVGFHFLFFMAAAYHSCAKRPPAPPV